MPSSSYPLQSHHLPFFSSVSRCCLFSHSLLISHVTTHHSNSACPSPYSSAILFFPSSVIFYLFLLCHPLSSLLCHPLSSLLCRTISPLFFPSISFPFFL